MLRHALAPMFEPGSLVIVADRPAGGGIPVAGAQGPLHGGRLRRGRGARAARQPERPAPGERPDRPWSACRRQCCRKRCAGWRRCRPLRHPAAARTARSVSARHAGAVPRLGRGKPLRAAGAALLRRAAPARRPEPQPAPGAGARRVALLAQSRSIMAAVMDWAEDVHIGFSVAVSLGDEAVVGLSKVLDYWPATRAPTASCSIWRTSGRRASS